MKNLAAETHYGGLLAELPAVSWMTVAKAQTWLGPHLHSGAYEITYVVRGRIDFVIENDVYSVEPGQVFVTPADVVHGGVNSVLGPNEHCLVHVAFPSGGASLPGLDAASTRILRDRFAALRRLVFPVSPTVKELILRILVEHRRPTKDSRILARGALHELLVMILRDHDAQVANGDEEKRRLSRAVVEAKRWLDEHVAESVQADGLGQAVGLSASHLRQLFLKELGVTPREYLSRRRIDQAKQLLATTRTPVTRIALSLGFPSGQYFSTVFKRHAGMTPVAFRRRSR